MDSISPSERHQLALLGATSVLRGLLAEAARGEVLARHRVGAMLRDLTRSPRKYGQRCVERVAEELGMARSTLYRYVAVAECWCSRDIIAQSVKTDRFGHPLTWTHFLALSKVAESSLRQALLDRCLAEAWSSRELALRVATLIDRPVIPEANEPLESVREALEDGIGSATRATTEVTAFAEAMSSRLAELKGEADDELIMRAIAAMDELRSRAEITLTQLERTQRASMRCLRWPSRAELGTQHSEDDEGELAEEGVSPVEPRIERQN